MSTLDPSTGEVDHSFQYIPEPMREKLRRSYLRSLRHHKAGDHKHAVQGIDYEELSRNPMPSDPTGNHAVRVDWHRESFIAFKRAIVALAGSMREAWKLDKALSEYFGDKMTLPEAEQFCRLCEQHFAELGFSARINSRVYRKSKRRRLCRRCWDFWSQNDREPTPEEVYDRLTRKRHWKHL